EGSGDDVTAVFVLFVVTTAGTVKLVMFVPQSAAGLLGSATGLAGVVGNGSSSANSLITQKLPDESTLMPLRSPAVCGTPKAGPTPRHPCKPACTSTGASIVPSGSDGVRPVTYMDMKSSGLSVPD